jgi:hypothetical protein
MHELEGDGTATVEVLSGNAPRALFLDAEIALQVLRRDVFVNPTTAEKRGMLDSGRVVDQYHVWNRMDSPTNPFCTKGTSEKFVELKKGQQFIVFGEDPYGGAIFRANKDDPDDTREFSYLLIICVRSNKYPLRKKYK